MDCSFHREAALKKGPELKERGFGCCVNKDGSACTGAGKLVEDPQTKKVGIKCGKQNGSQLTAREAQRCNNLSAHSR